MEVATVAGDAVRGDAMARDAVSTAVGDAGSRDAMARDAVARDAVADDSWSGGNGVGNGNGGLHMALNMHGDGHLNLIGYGAVDMDGHLLDDTLLDGVGHWLLDGHWVWLGHVHGVGTIDRDLHGHLNDLLDGVGLWHLDGHLDDLLHLVVDDLLNWVGLWHWHLDWVGDGLLHGVGHMTLHLVGHLNGPDHRVGVHLCGQRDSWCHSDGCGNGGSSAQNGTATNRGWAIAVTGVSNATLLLLVLGRRAALDSGRNLDLLLSLNLSGADSQHAHSQQAKNKLQCERKKKRIKWVSSAITQCHDSTSVPRHSIITNMTIMQCVESELANWQAVALAGQRAKFNGSQLANC